MLKSIRILFANRILGKDLYLVTLETPEKLEYEIHYSGGSKTFGTKVK